MHIRQRTCRAPTAKPSRTSWILTVFFFFDFIRRVWHLAHITSFCAQQVSPSIIIFVILPDHIRLSLQQQVTTVLVIVLPLEVAKNIPVFATTFSFVQRIHSIVLIANLTILPYCISLFSSKPTDLFIDIIYNSLHLYVYFFI